jgi:hypothetical protein
MATTDPTTGISVAPWSVERLPIDLIETAVLIREWSFDPLSLGLAISLRLGASVPALSDGQGCRLRVPIVPVWRMEVRKQ